MSASPKRWVIVAKTMEQAQEMQHSMHLFHATCISTDSKNGARLAGMVIHPNQIVWCRDYAKGKFWVDVRQDLEWAAMRSTRGWDGAFWYAGVTYYMKYNLHPWVESMDDQGIVWIPLNWRLAW